MGERMLAGIRQGIAGHDDLVVEARGKGLLMAIEFRNNEIGFEFVSMDLDSRYRLR